MKFNKFTAALIGLGVLSLASVAQASNPVVYLAGASALRSIAGGTSEEAVRCFFSSRSMFSW